MISCTSSDEDQQWPNMNELISLGLLFFRRLFVAKTKNPDLFKPVETNWMWNGKARRPSLPSAGEVHRATVRSENRCAGPTTTTSSHYTLPPPLLYFLPPASFLSELSHDPAPLNLKALCYMISLNLNQPGLWFRSGSSCSIQSTAIHRIKTLVVQMIHAMGPLLSWFCTPFEF